MKKIRNTTSGKAMKCAGGIDYLFCAGVILILCSIALIIGSYCYHC